MANSCEAHYRSLAANCQDVIIETFKIEGNVALQAASHGFVDDLAAWRRYMVVARPESALFSLAIGEYQFGLLAVAQGQYRQAFMALRLSLELLLGCVFFSANELELRTWLRGERDLVWSAIVHQDSGVLSKKFVRAFYDALADEAPHYRSLAEKVYRECSEYVHANIQASLDARLIFQQRVFTDWHAKAKTIRLVASFALCARYIDLSGVETRAALEQVLMENLGHLPAVRARLGVVVEGPYA